ncbi:MAG: GNA1162 family protein [Steroidobacteraceae bacterium]
MTLRTTLRLLALFSVLSLAACATPVAYDYTAFRRHPPRSILVLPPLNQSTAVEGTYSYLSTVTLPLAERGYYVFPVAVIDQLMKENGLPTAGEMHAVPPAKIHEITGADAVLYVVLHQYGSKYVLLGTTTSVEVSARLVDTRSGEVLWDGKALAQQNSNGNSGNILADMIAAAIVQVINSKTDPGHQVSRLANAQLFGIPKRELPTGPLLLSDHQKR